jgi:hypothetical protein
MATWGSPQIHTPKIHTPKIHTPKIHTPKIHTLLKFRENQTTKPAARTSRLVQTAKPVARTPRLVVGLGIGSVGLGNLRLESGCIMHTLPQNFKVARD